MKIHFPVLSQCDCVLWMLRGLIAGTIRLASISWFKMNGMNFFDEFDFFVVQNPQKCPVTIEGEKNLILFVQTDGLAPLVSEGQEISLQEEVKT